MKEKSGNPPEGKRPKPREEEVLVCPHCKGFGVVDEPWDKDATDRICPVCEGWGEIYET